MEKIKILELFSGIQAQERALRQLPIEYESVGVCDCDKDVLVSAAAMRWDLEKEIENFDFPTQEKMIEHLQSKNIGYSFEKGKHTITNRTPIDKLKQYYISDVLSKNLGDISKVTKLPYADLVTYSSPCQSFSVAGKLAGAKKICKVCGHEWEIDFSNPNYNYKCPHCGSVDLSSTTSGLLQEVQRLLAIAYKNNELPKYLLLENVKNLVGKQFKPQFDSWVKWLDSIGYNTSWKVLNSKHFGIPQNRERIFAISIRKDIDNGFEFPKEIPLTTRLKDVLEKNVDEKYYLPDDRIEKILNSSFMQEKKRIQTTDVCDTLLARDWKDPKCVPVEDEIKIIGNYMPSGHDASRVVDVDGVAPTVKENHGTVTAIAEPQVRKIGQASNEGSQCGTVYSADDLASTSTAGCHGYAMGYIAEDQVPFIVASRGRNPENPSDRTAGIKTEQRFEPNKEGICNCITSVQKDSYVVEPQVIKKPIDEYNLPNKKNIFNKNNTFELEPIIYDDYNSRISSDQDAINTLTCNCGAAAERNGVKIIEPVVCEERKDEGLRFFKDDVVGTLRTIDACGDKRVLEPQLNFVGGIGDKDWAGDGKQLSRNYPQGSRVYSEDGIAASLTAQGVGGLGGATGLYAVTEDIDPVRLGNIYGEQFGTGYAGNVWDKEAISPTIMTMQGGNRQPMVVDDIKWRIRKLTPKECWRLMGFTDEDNNRASQYVSASAQYKQAGNSICTSCLVAIFSSLLLENGYKADVWSKYLVDFNE